MSETFTDEREAAQHKKHTKKRVAESVMSTAQKDAVGTACNHVAEITIEFFQLSGISVTPWTGKAGSVYIFLIDNAISNNAYQIEIWYT